MPIRLKIAACWAMLPSFRSPGWIPRVIAAFSRGDLARRHRTAEEEGLGQAASVGPEEVVFASGLDPLGERGHAEGLRELDHGAHHAREVAVRVAIADERPVDLEDVDRH